MDDLLPQFHLVVTLREPLSQKRQANAPEKLIADVNGRLLIHFSILHVCGECTKLVELCAINLLV